MAVGNLEEVIVQVFLDACAGANTVVEAYESRQLLGDAVQVLHHPADLGLGRRWIAVDVKGLRHMFSRGHRDVRLHEGKWVAQRIVGPIVERKVIAELDASVLPTDVRGAEKTGRIGDADDRGAGWRGLPAGALEPLGAPRVELHDEEALPAIARRTIAEIADLAQVVLDKTDVDLLLVEGPQRSSQAMLRRQGIQLVLQNGLLHIVGPVVVLTHGRSLAGRCINGRGTV